MRATSNVAIQYCHNSKFTIIIDIKIAKRQGTLQVAALLSSGGFLNQLSLVKRITLRFVREQVLQYGFC